MTYTWTDEQKRGLTLGSRLEHSTVSIVAGARVLLAGDSQFRYLNTLDPATLQPPSLAFVQRLAKERLVGDVKVETFEGHDAAWDEVVILGDRFYISLYDTPTLDRFRAAVDAIVALGGSVLGKRGGET